MMTNTEIRELIENYDTKYQEGLMPDEIKEVIDVVIDSGHTFNEQQYENTMMGNTCSMREGQFCMYHCDVYQAIICAIEDREMTLGEWD